MSIWFIVVPTMDDILCPNCGKPVKIDQALRHQLEEKISQEQSEKHKIELEKAREEARLATEKALKEKSQKELEESEIVNKKLHEDLMTLKKQQEEAESKRKEQEEKIKEEAYKEASEKSRLEKLEYEKKLNDMQKSLEEAQRKGKQGSQQLQGEVLELDFENQLKQSFPSDEFLPVPKGVEGGDIWQKVKYQGKEVGTILWELKRTKAWSNSWITKLKDDAGRISASEVIIVSEVLPGDAKSFDRKDGVWLTEYAYALNICRYIRFLLTTIHSVKSKVSHTDEDWGKIRDYMMSDSFRHRMQAHFDGVKILRDDLDKEQRLTQIRWKRQHVLINKLDSNLINFYGELKALVPNLPELDDVESSQVLSDEESNVPLL